MKLKNLLLVVAISSVSLCANAGFLDWVQNLISMPKVNYGYWLCTMCNIPDPQDSVMSEGWIEDIQSYIKASNDDIHSSKNEKIHRWIADSSITICDTKDQCISVFYAAGSALWLTKGNPSFRKPPNIKPKEPRNQPISQPNAIEINISEAAYPPIVFITLPGDLGRSRVVSGSVTVIQDAVSTTYISEPINLDPIQVDIGNFLNWGPDSLGLDSTGTGGCGNIVDPFCVPA